MLETEKSFYNERLSDSQRERLIDIYQRAFKESPVWQEDLTRETVRQRLNPQFIKPGFCLIVIEQQKQIAAALWFDTPTLTELEAERGKQLADYAKQLPNFSSQIKIIWEREVIVAPESQRQGFAIALRQSFIELLKTNYPAGALILTRMRNNNLGIIKGAEKCGYQRTGIETDSNWRPPMKNSYWFKKINF